MLSRSMLTLPGALEYRHAVDHDRHARLLAHIALIFDAAQLDLDFVATGNIGSDAGDGLKKLNHVFRPLRHHRLCR